MPRTFLSFFTLDHSLSFRFPYFTQSHPLRPLHPTLHFKTIHSTSLITNPRFPYYAARPVAGKYTHSLALFSPLFGLACKYPTRLRTRGKKKNQNACFPPVSRVTPRDTSTEVTPLSSVLPLYHTIVRAQRSGLPRRACWFSFFPHPTPARASVTSTTLCYKNFPILLMDRPVPTLHINLEAVSPPLFAHGPW